MTEEQKPHSHGKVTKTIVSTPHTYKPVGPYSQAILVDKTLYVSGTLGLDPQAQLVCGGAEAQARQALSNMKHVLEAGGASLESVVKTTILLQDMADFQAVNQVYSECALPTPFWDTGVLEFCEIYEKTLFYTKGWNKLNPVYAACLGKIRQASMLIFPKDCPARATFQVAKLPAGAAVEIDAIALSGNLVISEAGPCPCAKE